MEIIGLIIGLAGVILALYFGIRDKKTNNLLHRVTKLYDYLDNIKRVHSEFGLLKLDNTELMDGDKRENNLQKYIDSRKELLGVLLDPEFEDDDFEITDEDVELFMNESKRSPSALNHIFSEYYKPFIPIEYIDKYNINEIDIKTTDEIDVVILNIIDALEQEIKSISNKHK